MVTTIVEQLGRGLNLADIIDGLEKDRGLVKSQITPILNAVVIDRMDYKTISLNLSSDTQSFDSIREETAKWNRFDIVIAYHHPQLGVSLINPKVSEQWESIQDFNREELVVCYIKGKRDEDRELERNALECLRDLLLGRQVSGTDVFNVPGLDAPPSPPAPTAQPAPAPPVPSVPQTAGSIPIVAVPPAAAAPAAPPPQAEAPKAKEKGDEAPAGGGKKRVTPKYSIQVTNELFHNGNVEAWKNIVESYKAAHSGLEVHIFHDGQKVNNINALFKWGKVKNGDVILFSVAGEEIKGVAKLQRYLFEGASLRFEKYLKKDVNKILNLFG